jgi:Fuc2NAc and GlcNAc transferase
MILFPILAAALTLILTGSVRRYAVNRALLDHPNHRSLHDSPTPRGGGIGIVIAVLAYTGYALVTGLIDPRPGFAIAGGGTIIAAVGWVDDIRSLSPRTRLIAQFAAAGWAMWWIGGLPGIDLGFARLTLGAFGSVLGLVLIVWLTNLYNFMDGSDGLAGIEAVFIAGGGGLLLFARNAMSLAAFAFVVLGAAIGFLYWNWPPAKIFMGDVGSGFLGFTFGTLAIWCEKSQSLPLLVWLILGSAFFVDASITLARRVPGRVWRYAHRSHAYQRAVISGYSHRAVALVVASLNLVLLGLAALAAIRPDFLLASAATAVLLTGFLYILVGRVQPFVLERPPAQP